MSFLFFILKIRKRLLNLRLRPIRVFCLHHVTEVYDSLRCDESDWIPFSSFKERIQEMKREYIFISLEEARVRLKKDVFRAKKYAVLTFDDGYSSVIGSLKWLEDNTIPYTLFLNGKYLDGASCSSHVINRAKTLKTDITESEIARNLYLSKEELSSLSVSCASFASHGYEHNNASLLTPEEFSDSVCKNFDALNRIVQPIPFHAYTWGRHTAETDHVLTNMGIVPVLMDGEKNYNNFTIIHREVFPLNESTV